MKKAFSFIEISIVLVIIAIVVTISSQHYIKAKKNSQKTICIQNMSTLDIAIENHRMSGELPIIPGEVQYLGMYKDSISKYLNKNTFPICSEGGFYSIINGNVTCSIHGSWNTDNINSQDIDYGTDTEEIEKISIYK
ncbi:MAG: prepilin-type N-terminal cleavage/methylation domain-containing protein [Candidatus Muirbacterium halophilum]|nr:prepilin-type N-terminal cleavage/methylation domain-containing protein [Candidatus Muirbacterium halophilum]MCK9474536.1 prepilin-type N-terminal cleavage/methylation domain-containing protein [Candidatus Muirbacterium halophilum]